MSRSPYLVNKERAALLVVDIQEKILAVMSEPDRVVENSVKLIKGFHALHRPIFATEQYPEALGQTVEKVQKALKKTPVEVKSTFSCCGIQDLVLSLRKQMIDQIVLCGIETHVCVSQTAFDLAHADLSVYICQDAVSSRKEIDYQAALHRMALHGITVTTSEAVLFEMVENTESEVFKPILKIIK